jgi:hypothetical protein
VPRCYAQCKSRRQDKNCLANIRLIDHTIGWADEPKDELSDQVVDAVWTIPQEASLNARRRKISWADGQELTVNQSVNRIHADHPHFPPELSESHLLGWIEQVMVSPYDSEQQLDELNQLADKWIEAHDSKAAAAQQGARTRHS